MPKNLRADTNLLRKIWTYFHIEECMCFSELKGKLVPQSHRVEEIKDAMAFMKGVGVIERFNRGGQTLYRLSYLSKKKTKIVWRE